MVEEEKLYSISKQYSDQESKTNIALLEQKEQIKFFLIKVKF